MEWKEFERRFNLKFIPEPSKNAKEHEFLKLKQGDLTMDEYMHKFHTLCYFSMNMDMSNREALQNI